MNAYVRDPHHTLKSWCYDGHHITREESKAWRGSVTALGPLALRQQSEDWNPDLSDLSPQPLLSTYLGTNQPSPPHFANE